MSQFEHAKSAVVGWVVIDTENVRTEMQFDTW